MNNNATIIETTDETFETDVLQRSRTEPVVVDFWADWCQPCRMLAPLLSQMADEFAGRVTVVKANTDHCQKAASDFGVSGIPAIFGVADAAIVDGLQGVVSEEVLRTFFRTMASAGELKKLRLLEQSDPAEALQTYQQMLADDTDNVPAKVGLGRAFLALGDLAAAVKVIDELESRGFLDPEAEQLKSHVSLSVDVPVDSVDDLQQRLAAEPDNVSLMVEVSRKHAAEGNFQAALNQALHVVERDKGNARDQARLLMIDIFRTLPEDSPLTDDYRRKLARALY